MGRRRRGCRRDRKQKEEGKGKSVGLRKGSLGVDVVCVQETRWTGNKAPRDSSCLSWCGGEEK